MPLVSQIVEMNGKKYLDGGIADSIPIKAAINMGFEKNIVVLTRPSGYRKHKFSMLWLAKIVYRKFPNFIKALKVRHEDYNQTLDYIKELEDSKKILVIRPSKLIKISRMETNPEIIKQMYELGRSDGLNMLAKVREFIL